MLPRSGDEKDAFWGATSPGLAVFLVTLVVIAAAVVVVAAAWAANHCCECVACYVNPSLDDDLFELELASQTPSRNDRGDVRPLRSYDAVPNPLRTPPRTFADAEPNAHSQERSASSHLEDVAAATATFERHVRDLKDRRAKRPSTPRRRSPTPQS